MSLKTIEEMIDDHWEELFHAINKNDDDLYELKIEFQEANTGKTIIRSWRDREQRLASERT